MFDNLIYLLTNETFVSALKTIWKLLPLWLPFILFSLFLQTWLRYKRTKWIKDQDFVLFEIRIPKEITKSPSAMEIVLSSFSSPSTGTFLDVFLKGRVRIWYSLEIVSIEGQVRFFIWASKKLKNNIESQIYAQYPTVEIYEVPDYALSVLYNPSEMSFHGAQFELTKPDPYPIKTYIDYGLEKDPKEEYKIDPITTVLEYLGSLRAGEQAWIQILIRAHREETLKKDASFFKKPDWKSRAKDEIKKIIEKDSFVKQAEDKPQTLQHLTDIQKETINAIERSLSKTAFDSMIRVMYLAKKDNFNPANIGGLLGSFKQFSSNHLNGFKPGWTTGFDYPWEDFRGIRTKVGERKILDAYKRRSFFYLPYKFFHGKPFVLTSEELATIYHFPGQVASTPTFSRIVSKKAEPPPNLPL